MIYQFDYIPNKFMYNFLQALEVIRLIKTVLPLDRAMMRLKVESSSKDAKKLKEKFVALASSVEAENWESGEITLVLNLFFNFY